MVGLRRFVWGMLAGLRVRIHAGVAANGANPKKRVAPQPERIWNFCGLKRGPLEPLQLLLDQWRTRKTGTPIQTGRPAGILLERVRTGIFEQRIR